LIDHEGDFEALGLPDRDRQLTRSICTEDSDTMLDRADLIHTHHAVEKKRTNNALARLLRGFVVPAFLGVCRLVRCQRLLLLQAELVLCGGV